MHDVWWRAGGGGRGAGVQGGAGEVGSRPRLRACWGRAVCKGECQVGKAVGTACANGYSGVTSCRGAGVRVL